MASSAEAVLDLVVNGKSFFSDLDTAEKRSKQIGSTFNQVGKQVDEFAQSMTGVGTNFEGLTSRISGVTASLGPAITGFISIGAVAVTAAAAAGAALFGLSERAAKVGADLDDMAEKTGIAVPRLSGLKFVADVTGSSLDQISNAVFKLQQNIGQGGAEVEKGFKRIGLSLQQIQSLNPDEQFVQIATAINSIVSPSERAAAAVELFGKQGRDLLPLLSKDFEGLIAKSEELGFTWSEQDAAAAEQFEEKSNELRLTLQNMATIIGKDLIPAFNIALDVSNWTLAKFLAYGPPAEILDGFRRIKDFATAMQFLFDERFGTIKPPTVAPPALFGTTKGAGGFVTDADFTAATKAIAEQSVQADLLAAHLRQLRKDVTPLTAEQREWAKQMLASGDSTKEAAQFLGVAEIAVKKFADAQKAAIEAEKKAREEAEKLIKAHIDLIDASEKDTEAAAKNIAKQVEGMTVLRDLGVEMGTIADSQRGTFIPAIEEITDGLVSMDDAILALNKQLPTLADAILLFNEGKFKSGFKEIGDVIAALLNPLSLVTTAIVNLVSRGINALEQLIEKGIVKLGQAIGNLISTGLGKLLDIFSNGLPGAISVAAKAAAQAADDIAAQKEAFEDLDATIKKYKFSVEELGPALERQNLDKLSQEIFHDWMLLASAGIKVSAIAREMGENINDFVQRAIKSGFEIPEALRPIIEQMIQLGELTDEAGNKITDINQAGIHFSMTMTQGFQRLIDAVNRLTAAITRTLNVTGALARAAGAASAAAAAAAAAQTGSSSSGNTGEPPVREAFGDYLHLVRPTRFLAAEAGREDVVFGGAGRNLAADVAMELARLQPSPTHAGATGGPSIIQLVVDSKVVAHATLDGIHSGGEARSKFDKLVGRLR